MEFSEELSSTLIGVLMITNTIFFTLFVVFLKRNTDTNTNLKNTKKAFNAYVESDLPIKESKEVFEFLNELILVKFKYYLNVHFMANFASDKEIDKKDIKKFKNDFYLDVSSTLHNKQKERLLKVFSQKGIELYIHQSFLRLFNDANIKFKNGEQSNTVDSMNRNTMQAIYG